MTVDQDDAERPPSLLKLFHQLESAMELVHTLELQPRPMPGDPELWRARTRSNELRDTFVDRLIVSRD